MKNEKHKKSLTTYQRQQENSLLLVFVYEKGCLYFWLEINLKMYLYNFISSKAFFSVTGYKVTKQSNETPASI